MKKSADIKKVVKPLRSINVTIFKYLTEVLRPAAIEEENTPFLTNNTKKPRFEINHPLSSKYDQESRIDGARRKTAVRKTDDMPEGMRVHIFSNSAILLIEKYDEALDKLRNLLEGACLQVQYKEDLEKRERELIDALVYMEMWHKDIIRSKMELASVKKDLMGLQREFSILKEDNKHKEKYINKLKCEISRLRSDWWRKRINTKPLWWKRFFR